MSSRDGSVERFRRSHGGDGATSIGKRGYPLVAFEASAISQLLLRGSKGDSRQTAPPFSRVVTAGIDHAASTDSFKPAAVVCGFVHQAFTDERRVEPAIEFARIRHADEVLHGDDGRSARANELAA